MAALSFIRATRPSLLQEGHDPGRGGWIAGGLAVALLLVLIAPFASGHPDGLEWVAETTGFLHTAQGEEYTAGGYLEEIFVHEGTHTSIDGDHGAAARWLEAQAAAGTFVSTYARDNPTREDVAETMVPYLAQRFRADRLAPGTVDTIRAAIPNRLRYLDCLGVTMATLP